MRHKKNTLTNLEIMLLNCIAVLNLRDAINMPYVLADIQEGRGVYYRSASIAKIAGYDKLATNHYAILNRLEGWGYIETRWISSRIKEFRLSRLAFNWLSIGQTISSGTQPEQLMTVTTFMAQPYHANVIDDIPF